MVGTFVRAGIQAIKAIKPGTKTGAKSVASWKAASNKAKLEAAKFNLQQTFKKTDTELGIIYETKGTIKKNY